MNFIDILENTNLLKILNKTLEYPKNNKEKDYNQYSLFTVIDFLIKYQIIIEEKNYEDYTVSQLDQIINNYKNHQELVLSLNNLLVNLICKKLNIIDKENNDNKKEIIKYLYDKYIVNGYFFHSFPSIIKNKVEEKGLTQDIDFDQNNNLKQINHIFNNHNYKNICNKNLDAKTNAIHLTDSPALAYYHSISIPSALSEITTLSKYYNYLKVPYDNEAFYRKDYNACKENITLLCKHLNMTEKEIITVLSAIDKEWKKLDITNSKPTIAFIKRRAISKDTLTNIDKILKLSENEDIVFSVARITDSKYRIVRRYTNIDKNDIKIFTLPSYEEIRNFKEEEKISLTITSDIKIEDKEEIQEPILNNVSYSYGRANVVALLGILLISLGLTLSIVFKVLGG